MSRATSSTRSVMMTRSLCPRRSWACCASCTLMDPSFPTLNLCGNEHSNCTPWAQRIVEPNLGLPAIQLLDFLYGEWGDDRLWNFPTPLQRRRTRDHYRLQETGRAPTGLPRLDALTF